MPSLRFRRLLCLAGLGFLGRGSPCQEPSVERWSERPGCALVRAEGALVRECAGVRTRLGCTDPAGTGRVLEVARDPAGLSFVAAENGLFVLGPFVDTLDRVEPGEQAPAGRVRSVSVDEARRVWIATEEAIGVLDPSFFWGRALAAADLPGPGPYRVEALGGGRVRLAGARAESLRQPSAGPPPRVLGLRVDGHELAAGALLRRAPEDALVLEATGEGEGGATFRFRFDRHHVWRELVAGAPVAVPRPGSHALEVIAIDQDLDRSEPFAVRVNVVLPGHVDARFLLAVGLGLGVATLALILWRQRVRGAFRVGRALVSSGLVLVLALQVFAGLEPHGKGWPFMGFNMYTRSYAPDEIIYDEQLVVLRPDGSELAVRPQSAGFMVDEPWEVMLPLINDGEPALRAFLEAWSARFPDFGARGLQVQARRSRLTRHGPVAIAPLILAHHRDGESGGAK